MDDIRPSGGGPGYEKEDVNVTRVAVFTLIMVAVLGLGAYFVPYFLFRHLAEEAQREDNPPPLYQPDVRPPAPRLQTHAARDLKELREGENRQLATYGWIDRDNGVVRVPIERAIELTAQRGLRRRPDVREESVLAGASPRKQP